ncbi:MAG TPA: hypothetical protein DCS93_05960 [Microscillaceae bacterium]|nr:hypothetical protein [Microscillaceae bacterium]
MKTDLKWILLALCCLSVTTGFGQKLTRYLGVDGRHIGLVNETYKIVQPANHYAISEHKFGYEIRNKRSARGFLNRAGEVTIPCENSGTYLWETQDLFWVKENDLWGLIDPKTGKVLFTPQFTTLLKLDKETAFVKNAQGLYGRIKADGTVLIPVIYAYLEVGNKGLLAACKQLGKYGYINPQGQVIIPLIYKGIYPFMKGKGYVTKDGENWMAIDASGKVISKVKGIMPPPPPNLQEEMFSPWILWEPKIKSAYPVFRGNNIKKQVKKKKVLRATYYDYRDYLQKTINLFASRNLRFPRKAHRKKIQGKVKLQFMMTEKGVLNDIKVLQGLPSGCNEEAIRLLRAIPKWIPAQDDGPIASLNMVEITFDYTQYNRRGKRKR